MTDKTYGPVPPPKRGTRSAPGEWPVVAKIAAVLVSVVAGLYLLGIAVVACDDGPIDLYTDQCRAILSEIYAGAALEREVAACVRVAEAVD